MSIAQADDLHAAARQAFGLLSMAKGGRAVGAEVELV